MNLLSYNDPLVIFGTSVLKNLFWLLWVILGLEITNNGILLTTDYQGRASGEAFVQFSSAEQTERALEKNKQSMGHRLVGVVQRADGPQWSAFIKKAKKFPIYYIK